MRYIFVILMFFFFVTIAYGDIEIKNHYFNAKIGEDFCINIYVYHPINAPIEAYEKAGYEESQYFRYPDFYRGDLSELRYSALNSISSPFLPQTIETLHGDDFNVQVIGTSENVIFKNLEIVEIDSSNYKILLNGHLKESAEQFNFEKIEFMISSSLLPELNIEHHANLICRSSITTADIFDEPVMGTDALGKCCVPCPMGPPIEFPVAPGGTGWIGGLNPGAYNINARIVGGCGNFTATRAVGSVNTNGYRRSVVIQEGLYDYFPNPKITITRSGRMYYTGLGRGDRTTLIFCRYNCDVELDEIPDIPSIVWTNDVPSFAVGLSNASALEYQQVFNSSIDHHVTIDTNYTCNVFPSTLSLDGTFPSKVTIHFPTDPQWRQNYADASLIVYPLKCEIENNVNPQLLITCPQADSSSSYTFEVDPQQPTIPIGKYFGYITPVSNEFQVSLELINGKSVTFDNVVLVSDSLGGIQFAYDLSPQLLKVSSPRTVGEPIDFTARIYHMSLQTLADVEMDIWIEDEFYNVVSDTMTVFENGDLPSFDTGLVYHFLHPDQTWIPSEAGKYRAVIAIQSDQNLDTINDTLRTDVFEVYPAGIFSLEPAIIDTSQYWGTPYSDAMIYSSSFNCDSLSLKKIITEWEKPGTATLHIKALVNGLPAQDLITPINISVGQSTEYPIKVETFLPSDPDLVDLTEFWVELASPTDGARLSMANYGSTWSKHYRKLSNNTWYEMNGDWRITPIGYHNIQSLSGSQSGVLTQAGGPYLVTGNLSVAEFDTLEIEDGTTLLFDGYYKLAVDGTLKIKGTASNPVYMSTSIGTTQWEGLDKRIFRADLSQ